MGRRKVSTNVYFEPEQLDALKTIAFERRVAFSVIIREIADEIIAKHKRGEPLAGNPR